MTTFKNINYHAEILRSPESQFWIQSTWNDEYIRPIVRNKNLWRLPVAKVSWAAERMMPPDSALLSSLGSYGIVWRNHSQMTAAGRIT